MLGYGLFLLVAGTLFVRPTDLTPSLYTVPLYEILIAPCILIALPKLVERLSVPALAECPTTVCMLGLWVAVVLSSLVNTSVAHTVEFSTEIAKMVLFYLLLLGLVDTPGRLRGLMAGIVLFSVFAVGAAVLVYHGYIHISAVRFYGVADVEGIRGEVAERRMGGTGVFGDPNDICQNIAVTLLMALAFLGDRRMGGVRLLWAAPMVFLGYALTLTQSRGGFVALLAGLVTLFQARFGLRRSLWLLALVLPVVMVLVGARQGSISFSSGTGRIRLNIWAQSLTLFRGSPLFGIGTNQMVGYFGKVAHNSFVHAYTELGLLGGTMYFGMFFYVIWMLLRLGSPRVRIADPELRRLRPYVAAMVVTYAAGELSLTHCYNVQTYAYLGLGSAYIRMAQPYPPLPGSRTSPTLFARFLGAGLAFYLALILFAKLKVHWGG